MSQYATIRMDEIIDEISSSWIHILSLQISVKKTKYPKLKDEKAYRVFVMLLSSSFGVPRRRVSNP
ncbi:MAG TPA: hypothetical protein PK941_02965 [Paludibacter sp.]|nr:hypothetical protein [Paludibacter sp.]